MTIEGLLISLLLAVLAVGALMVATLVRVGRLGRGGGDDPSEAIRAEFRAMRQEAAEQSRALREELMAGQIKASDHAMQTIRELDESRQQALERIRTTLEEGLKALREGNEKKLEAMRRTVDEKLQSTLEKRLGESFALVSERLEAVQRGLGEMRNLASGVGDLKRMLTNVKARGTWGEYQLGAILERVLSPGQYEKNVSPRGGSEVVEYAVKLPAQGDEDRPVWLPIDAKFPQEDYERLQEAAEASDAEALQSAVRALSASIRKSAKEISEKYLEPPLTTDFAILFLPTEGLYAEVLRQPGLHDELQTKHRVIVAGPTTLSAILNSLRVGFRTLAIEKRSAEVWRILAAVKTEFGKFGEVLTKVKRQLGTVAKTLDQAETRTRQMERKLRPLEELPSDDSKRLLDLPDESAQ